MLSVKQVGIKYHFLSLWYDLTRDWTEVSRVISEHSNNYGLVSLFNGISTLFRLFNAKAILLEEQ